MDDRINKFNETSQTWFYRASDLLDPQLHIDELLDGADELEPAKYSLEEVPELSGYLIHFRADGSMLEAHKNIYKEKLKNHTNLDEIILELEYQAKLRIERDRQRRARQIAASTAERKAEMNDPEWQKEMWRNDLQLQLWDENSDLSGEQRSVYERQLSGLR
jgi:hypothetical protein